LGVAARKPEIAIDTPGKGRYVNIPEDKRKIIPPGKWRYVNDDGILYTEEFKDITENLNQRAANKFGSLLNKLSESKRISTKSSKNANIIKAEKQFRKLAQKTCKKAENAKKRAANAANRIGASFKGKRNRNLANRLRRPLTEKQKVGILLSRHIHPNILKAYGIINDWTDPIPGRIARRFEIERDMRIRAAENNANIERAKAAREKRGRNTMNAIRRRREEEAKRIANDQRAEEMRAARRAEDWRLAEEATAAVAAAAMAKGAEYVGAVRKRGAAGKDAVVDFGATAMQTAGPLMGWATGHVQNRVAAARKWHVDYQAERAERKKQEKIEFDAMKKRNNATRKVQARWRNKKRRRIERSEEAQQIRSAKNDILRELEEIKGLNEEISAKKRSLNKHVPYERWMAYINELDLHETRARIKGRPNTDPPRPERTLVDWAKSKYGNMNLRELIKEIKRRPPASRSEIEREIQQMQQRKKTKSSLQNDLRELNQMYKGLFA
jgi:hypothetical protein